MRARQQRVSADEKARRRRAREAAKERRCARPGCDAVVTYQYARYCSASCHYADRTRVAPTRRKRARGAKRTAWNEGAISCVRCGQRGAERHHAIYEQHVIAADAEQRYNIANRVGLCTAHHKAHHARTQALPLSLLPDSVFAFAVELLGAGAAYNYLRRRYAGDDPRLAALLDERTYPA